MHTEISPTGLICTLCPVYLTELVTQEAHRSSQEAQTLYTYTTCQIKEDRPYP